MPQLLRECYDIIRPNVNTICPSEAISVNVYSILDSRTQVVEMYVEEPTCSKSVYNTGK